MRMERLGPFLLRQPPGVFPLGEDALRLAAFAAGPRGRLCCPGQFGGERAGRDGLGRGLERADRRDGSL